MKPFFISFAGSLAALAVFTVFVGTISFFNKKKLASMADALKADASARLQKLCDQIEDIEHRKKAHENLSRAITSNNVADFQEVTTKIMDYLKKQREAKMAGRPPALEPTTGT